MSEIDETTRQQQGAFWLDYSQRLSTAIRYVEALAAAERAVRLLSTDAEARYTRGTCQAMLSHYTEALADFDAALQLNPRSVEAWDGRAWVLGILGHKNEALAAVEQALVLDPDYFEAQKRKKRLLAME